MTCLSNHDQGADLLTGYLAKTLDTARMAECARHFEECADCRGLVNAWERLDEFAAPEVSSDFDTRLYARIAREDERVPGWRRWLWRPAAPVAAAAAVAVLVLLVRPPGSPDAFKQNGPAEIEQVAQAVDDLDLLIPLDR